MIKGEGLFTQEGAGALQGRRGAFAGILEWAGQYQVLFSMKEGRGVFLFGGGISIQRNRGAKIFWEVDLGLGET